jgi:hypothetical protein
VSTPSKVVADFSPIKGLNANLERYRNARVKVGILANHATREEGSAIDNPSLGLAHEFGVASQNLPSRSFIRMPLMVELPKKMQQVGPKIWEALISQKGIKGALEQLGAAAVQTIEMAFRTGGFGRWQQWSVAYARRRELKSRKAYRGRLMDFIGPIKPGSILIDTGQLRRSISFAVVEEDAK